MYAAYPNMDFSKYDQDANGYFDAVVLLNAGTMSPDEGYNIISFGGGVMSRLSYTGDRAGTQQRPTFNCYTNVHANLLANNTLIHEFAHNLGLIDYYDVTYSGINAVGGYDMQSDSYGDWNPYSKYAVGWIEPKVVTGLNAGESVEIEIGSLAKSGDAIVIPAAGSSFNNSPFGEYIMVDLFTAEGVNTYDAAKYGLQTEGVRIYHVNASMEKRVLNAGGKAYTIGTIHYANDYKNDGLGRYNVELIQSGGNNTFTDFNDLRSKIQASDLFKAGNVFTASKYREFLYDGRMDDGSEFGYSIEVVSIYKDAVGDYKAKIRITRN